MFGLFRTFLACVVIIGHLHGPFQIGTYAVFGFYILSGYLMTTIMHGSYGYHASGRKRYVLNRLLIIYSTYWIAALLSLVCLFILGDKVSQFIYTIYFPSTISVWLKNFFLILTSLSSPRLSPATWALTVELFYYAMICIGISQTPRLSIIWLIGSLVYTGYLLFDDPANWASRYFPIPAASLPFAIGGCLYHFRSTFSRMLRATRISNPAIWTILICLNFYIFSTIDKKWGTDLRSSLGFYVNLVLIISTISACLSRGFPLVDKELDKFLGKFSYPAYLMHWQAGAIILALFSFDLNRGFMTMESLTFLALSVLLTIGLSYAAIKTVDDPIEEKRSAIRAKTIDTSPASLPPVSPQCKRKKSFSFLFILIVLQRSI